ncbi:hypothetical protein [Methylobacterium planeticum]|uniref:hypothetical protein n=1 Tax=Methylobacterium planeticum TaxID=2615211 RepID=UPI001FEF3566|nr:hypothetical protein [Methylobacterium planeticum]
MPNSQTPGPCPILRRLITLVARIPEEPGLPEQGRIIDQLTDLETESLSAGAPRRTTEAIRAVRLTVRVASLMPHPPGLRSP